ncbi:Inositol-1-monophosphatase family protein [Platysternon megacephalum]|uniref:Inositol-1-monophosphatase family protein n=1 Tax=Platysternon megacephalum TaxID=55544 RepID=A0A4D9DJ08_9SAUR|nr:Inositol-1-monophosphatase family protein [Platysternon megacephalum]
MSWRRGEPGWRGDVTSVAHQSEASRYVYKADRGQAERRHFAEAEEGAGRGLVREGGGLNPDPSSAGQPPTPASTPPTGSQDLPGFRRDPCLRPRGPSQNAPIPLAAKMEPGQ